MKKSCILLLIILLSLQGCTGSFFAITTGGLIGCHSLLQDKSVGHSIDDRIIWGKINFLLLKNKSFLNITAQVDEGVVLLTGIVESEEASITIGKLVLSITGVKDVLNEILVQEDSESVLKSSVITFKIKSKLLFDKSIKSFNYLVMTVDEVVYLFGLGQSQAELDKVIEIASNIYGVEQVVSHVRVRNN